MPNVTGFTKVKSVLDSGASYSCAPDCMCPEVKSRPSRKQKRSNVHSSRPGENCQSR